MLIVMKSHSDGELPDGMRSGFENLEKLGYRLKIPYLGSSGSVKAFQGLKEAIGRRKEGDKSEA